MAAGGRRFSTLDLFTHPGRKTLVTPGRSLSERGWSRDAARRETALLVGDHPQNLRQIGLVDHSAHIHLALALGALGSQDVALESETALHLARTRLLEALGGAAVSLHLRHCVS